MSPYSRSRHVPVPPKPRDRWGGDVVIFTLLALLVLWMMSTATTVVTAIAPYATYEQVFQYSNGQISVNQTAELLLTDTDSGGLLNVGGYVLKVQSLPPQLLYRATEVGRIPLSATMHVEEVCLVSSAADTSSGTQKLQRMLGKPASHRDDCLVSSWI